jgi:hypothetical protein
MTKTNQAISPQHFDQMVSTAHQIGDHFVRSNADREKVRLWCSMARHELVDEISIDRALPYNLDCVDKILDIVEARSLQAN